MKTSVLVFAKGGRTERVMFLHASNDGFKLDANHEQPIEADDLPGLIAAFNSRGDMLADWQNRDAEKPWTENWWFADCGDHRARGFQPLRLPLPTGKSRGGGHRDPRELLAELRDETAAILGDIEALAAELGRGAAA